MLYYISISSTLLLWISLLSKYPHIISYFASIPAILMHLISLSPDSSSIHRVFSGVPTSQWVCKMCHEWWSLPVPFHSSSLEKTVKSHNFGVIFSDVGIGWHPLFDSFDSSTSNLSKYTACHHPFLLLSSYSTIQCDLYTYQ